MEKQVYTCATINNSIITIIDYVYKNNNCENNSNLSNIKIYLDKEKELKEFKIKKMLGILKLKFSDSEDIENEILIKIISKILSSVKVFNNNHKTIESQYEILNNQNDHSNIISAARSGLNNNEKIFNHMHTNMNSEFDKEYLDFKLNTFKQNYKKNLENLSNIINYLNKILDLQPSNDYIDENNVNCFCFI